MTGDVCSDDKIFDDTFVVGILTPFNGVVFIVDVSILETGEFTMVCDVGILICLDSSGVVNLPRDSIHVYPFIDVGGWGW